MTANADDQTMFGQLSEADTAAALMYLSGVAYDQQVEQDRWLDSHPPLACYQVTWDAHQRMVHSLKAALDAIRSGDLTTGNELLDVALADSRAHTDSLDLATC
jgi:hypothetical protein